MKSKYCWICLFSLPLFTALIATCGRRDEARISLTVEGAPDSTEAVVSRLVVNELEILDTLYTEEGKASCRVPVTRSSPEFIYLTSGGMSAALLLSSGDEVSVSLCGPDSAVVSGPEESELMLQVDKDIRRFNRRFDSLSEALFAAQDSGNEKEVKALKREIGMMYVRRKQDALRYIMTHLSSMTVLPVLYHETSDGLRIFSEAKDALIMERVYDSLYQRYPDSPYLPALADEARARRNILEIDNIITYAEEVDYPEIILNDIEGKQRQLSALSGKVILLCFWDSSNTEQRIFNVGLKELYEKYSTRGLEIYQVALNTDKTAWAMQVREQELPWISVCDPAGASSMAAMQYNVTELPAMYVISRSGEIIARDLFNIDMLESEVSGLL